jgi:hypothetical protein
MPIATLAAHKDAQRTKDLTFIETSKEIIKI